MADRRRVFLDTTVLSNFASRESVRWLAELLERPAVVPAVREKLELGRNSGHPFLAEAVEAIGTDVELVEASDDNRAARLRERIDIGEADTVAAAIENEGALATDDSAARSVARDHQVRVTGSVGLLVLGIERGVLDVETADRWLDTWRTGRGYYAPVERVSEALPE